MRLPKILIVPGSSRGNSHNIRLAASAHKIYSTLDCEVTRITLGDYPLPIYDGDLETQKGPPENATRLARLFDAHHGIMLITPEYNGSTTPLLKNTLDWVSRIHTTHKGPVIPYKGKTFAIGAASPGGLGGIRSLGHLRDILTSMGATVIAAQVAVGGAGDAFDDMDQLTNERANNLLTAACNSLVDTARLLSMK
jgi:chromate reductase